MDQFKHICIILQLPPYTGIITGKQPKKMKLGFRINTGRKLRAIILMVFGIQGSGLKKNQKKIPKGLKKKNWGFYSNQAT